MTDRLTIACAQANPLMGDIGHNLGLAREARAEAATGGADLVLFSELFVCGYPPEDLVLKSSFVGACRRAVEELARETTDGGPAVLVGTPWPENGKVFNSVCLLQDGGVAAVRHKVNLPVYGAFEQVRLFAAGELPGPIHFRGVALGVPICEDIWIDEVVECLEETGAELLLVPNGSPWWRGKHDLRLNVAVARVTESRLPLLYANQVGGQDELVFDGASFGLNGDRSLAFQMPAFETGVALTRWERQGDGWRCVEGPVVPLPGEDELTWLACVHGLRDYVEKNGYSGAVIGIASDAGSALGAALAVDALGLQRVRLVVMPDGGASVPDARSLAEELGVRLETVGIEDAAAAVEAVLGGYDVNGVPFRLRGLVLALIAQGLGALWIRTESRTDLSIDRTGFDADPVGGFNPVGDFSDRELRRLAEWRSRNRPKQCLGPEGPAIVKSLSVDGISPTPAADSETGEVPPREILDDILKGLIDDDLSARRIAESRSVALEAVQKVEDMMFSAEYKRRQSAPGLRLLPPDQGRGRCWPMTNRFRDGGE